MRMVLRSLLLLRLLCLVFRGYADATASRRSPGECRCHDGGVCFLVLAVVSRGCASEEGGCATGARFETDGGSGRFRLFVESCGMCAAIVVGIDAMVVHERGAVAVSDCVWERLVLSVASKVKSFVRGYGSAHDGSPIGRSASGLGSRVWVSEREGTAAADENAAEGRCVSAEYLAVTASGSGSGVSVGSAKFACCTLHEDTEGPLVYVCFTFGYRPEVMAGMSDGALAAAHLGCAYSH